MFSSPLLPTLGGYWDGRFQTTPACPSFDVIDPATGNVLATLAEQGAEQAEAALSSARKALVPHPVAERRRWLTEFAAHLREHAADVAAILTAENGKPLAESEGEVRYAAGFFEDAVRHLDHLEPTTLELTPKDHRWRVFHRPSGVAALITPWNFPIGMLAKKLAGALAADCPVVIKPSELTPLTCIAAFTLLDRIGLPAGMVNLVIGDAPAIGAVWCESKAVRVLSFTGSTGVGRKLAAQCAPSLKRLSMELGGNAPFVVFADADLDATVRHLMANKFRCAGQTCVCSNRVLVESRVHDAFVEKLAVEVAALRVGPGSAPGTEIGPLIERRAWDKVHELVADGVANGAKVVVGTLRDAPQGPGNFFEPLVLVDVLPTMRLAQEEIFGPVVAIGRFEDEAEAVELANDTEYGLAAYVFSEDSDRLDRVAAQLHFGHVGLNSGTGPTPEAPFGGMQQSGMGREGGLEGVLEFIELQTCPTPLA